MAVVYMQLKQTHLHYKVYLNFITVIEVTFIYHYHYYYFHYFIFFFMTIPFSLEPKNIRMGNVRRIVTTKLIITILIFIYFLFIYSFISCIVLVTAWAAENGMWQLMHYKPSVIRMTAYNHVAKLLLIIFASGLQWCCQLLVIGQCCQIPRVQNYRIVGEVFDC